MGISFPMFSEGNLKLLICIGSYDGFYKSYSVMDHDKHIYYKFMVNRLLYSLYSDGARMPHLSCMGVAGW